jgi:hypothetical protein
MSARDAIGFEISRQERVPEPLADWAIEQGEQKALDSAETFCDWLCGAPDEREQSAYFGPISTWELQSLLLNPQSNDAQRKAACDEMRKRYLAEKAEWVLRMASEAMEMQ